MTNEANEVTDASGKRYRLVDGECDACAFWRNGECKPLVVTGGSVMMCAFAPSKSWKEVTDATRP